MNYSKKDGKIFWKLLDKIEQKQDDTIFKQGIPGQKWISHFKSIFQDPKGRSTLPQNTTEIGNLDYEITDEEINAAGYILRNNKVVGYDIISNEMLSCLLEAHPHIVKRIFNHLLKNPISIDRWNISMISPIHKGGPKSDTENYRGISLLSCFSKFFFAILNKRITKFVVDNNIISKAQLGFISGCRTSDALLILHNLIEHYCKTHNKHMYGCFVDFQKAFDSVPRSKLFQKLLDYNINGKIYDWLVEIYSHDIACVKIGNTLTNSVYSAQYFSTSFLQIYKAL